MAVKLNSLSRYFILAVLGMLVFSFNSIKNSPEKVNGNAHLPMVSQPSRDTTTPASLESGDNTRIYESKLAQMPAADRKLVLQGRQIFSQICATCHGRDGKSLTAMGAPPLVNSKRVNGESAILVRILLDGLIGPIDGKTYPDYMPSLGAANDDEWIASVLSYIRNDFGNLSSPIVKVEEVTSIRSKSPGRASMWTLDELSKLKK